jgi:alkaline phosphatase
MITRRWGTSIALVAVLLAALSGVSFAGGTTEKGASPAAPPATQQAEKAKYVFLFIGDGMAAAQINSAEIYKSATASAGLKVAKLSFTQFPVSGLTTTFDASSFVTDSASAMTTMMTGTSG